MESYYYKFKAALKRGLDFNSVTGFFCTRRLVNNNRGIALLTALILSITMMGLVSALFYFILQSTEMSTIGKRYATAAEAADGAVDVMKEAIELIMNTSNLNDLSTYLYTGTCSGEVYDVKNAILTQGSSCETTITLPSNTGNYQVALTFERLYTKALPGARTEFARAGGVPTTAIYYKIISIVTGANGTQAETSAIYRFVG